MPHNRKQYPYIVVGDGNISRENIVNGLKVGMIKHPIPEFSYASTMKIALEIADKMAKWHETVTISEIRKVVK